MPCPCLLIVFLVHASCLNVLPHSRTKKNQEPEVLVLGVAGFAIFVGVVVVLVVGVIGVVVAGVGGWARWW